MELLLKEKNEWGRLIIWRMKRICTYQLLWEI